MKGRTVEVRRWPGTDRCPRADKDLLQKGGSMPVTAALGGEQTATIAATEAAGPPGQPAVEGVGVAYSSRS
jgi:hypothetical protein